MSNKHKIPTPLAFAGIGFFIGLISPLGLSPGSGFVIGLIIGFFYVIYAAKELSDNKSTPTIISAKSTTDLPTHIVKNQEPN